jgi:Tol biopolymer transport system component
MTAGMDPNRWIQIEELYHAALERPPNERAAFLDGACTDAGLRAEVESLLDQPEEGVLDPPSANLIAGARRGPYENLGCIAAGGMGAVYTARDPRLDRTVAIKISTMPWSGRSRREARAVAALNHPHICTLYDVGPNYLVMEYVDGKPLKGPLPLPEALRLAGQLLDALDTAHRKGIVHRDLKPANILVTTSGVKVLDFGLAKVETAYAGPSDTRTKSGVVIGTLHYMSPEQVQGRAVDHRSDIFSFGLVLYEMLTGRRAFDGPNSAAVVSAILEGDPPQLGEIWPPSLQRVLRRCLAKDPADRWQSAAELRTALMEDRPKRRPPLGWIAAACFALLAGALAVTRTAAPPPDRRVVRFQVAAATSVPPALSPDGRRLVYAVRGDRPLRVRALDSLESQDVPGTEGAADPFWSPDGKEIAFFAHGELKRVALTGGAAITLTDVSGPNGADWNRQGEILYSPSRRSPILRIPAAGGGVSAVTALDTDKGEIGHGWPSFLPGGRAFLYTVYAAEPANGGVFVEEIGGVRRTRILPDQTNARYVEPGFVLYRRGGALLAQPFDPMRLRFTGEAARLAEPAGEFSAASGILAYSAGAAVETRLRWLDRSGQPLGDLGEPDAYRALRLSPNGTAVATLRNEIWIFDTARLTGRRLADGDWPVWSPDGRQIAFSGLPPAIRRIGVDGKGVEEIAGHLDRETILSQWTRDGKYVIVTAAGGGRPDEVWAVPVGWAGKPFPLVAGPYSNRQGNVSPDGRWLAYAGDESGAAEIYLRSFPEGGDRRRISTAGGVEPRWRGDGRELFYREGTKVMSVEVKASAAGFEADTPRLVFDAGGSDDAFVVTVDGRRFLLMFPADDGAPRGFTVVLNWPTTIMK